MSRLARYAATVVLTAVVVHAVAIHALPRVIMSRVMQTLQGNAGVNRLVHPGRATADDRLVVRPSPDLAYSICVFDLSDGPARVTTPVPDGYMSVSMFADNTDNFFVVNDRDVRPAAVDLIVVGPGQSTPDLPGSRVVESPSERGLVVVRRVIENDAHFERLDRLRREARCEPLR